MSPWSMLLEPAILFFVLGVLVALLGSNLEIPQPVAKFLSLYLLMAVGFKGGQSLAHTGLNAEVGRVVVLAMILAVAIPAWSYLILKRGVGLFDAAAIAATYGSVSAVTFTVASQFVAAHGAPTSGGATVALVLMESPAIIMAVLLASWARSHAAAQSAVPGVSAAEAGVESVVPEAVASDRPAAPVRLKAVLHEAFTDGAHLLLIGSLIIGALAGEKGAEALKPFTGDLFKGFLAFFLLEMGILVGRQMRQVRDVGPFLLGFGLVMPPLHALVAPVFADFAKKADVYTIAQPGLTDALEFEDGKIMVGKHFSLKEVNWKNIQERFGAEKFAEKFNQADFVGFVNWTMLPYMSDLWDAVLKEVLPQSKAPRRVMFFDLADPEKRTKADIQRALKLIVDFEKYFEVVLGLNEKEAYEIGAVLGLNTSNRTRDGLVTLCKEIAQQVKVSTLMVHPVQFALAVTGGVVSIVDGPFEPNPKITTGAGDHMNSGFCLGKMLGFDNTASLLTGVSTSGFYVRNAASPSIADLAKFLQNWPA